MTGPDRSAEWAAIQAIFHRALETPDDRRAAFLDSACAGRPDRLEEVRSLLAAHARAGDFIEQPAGDLQGLQLPAPEPRHRPGDLVGPYRIDAVIGQGGMGIVFRAEDTRLGRVVALKAVTPRHAGDEGRRERLRREARTAAALSHPGIATVYALEDIGGELFIVSEYVEGETLRDELRRPRPSIDDTLATVLEIARVLAAPHAQGIVHRDLKPENVMRTRDGRIKILDFGIARLGEATGGDHPLTGDDIRLGTPGYMAPEQIRGGTVDARADLFAFGVLVYELSTGVHPFASDHPASTVARVLEFEPPDLTSHVPPAMAADPRWQSLARIVRVCLEKTAAARFSSTPDLVAALETARRGGAESGGAATPRPSAAAEVRDASRWWQFHQAAASAGYLAMLVPLNYVRQSDRDALGVGLFLAGLVAALAASTLRMHLWFTRRWYASEWPAQRQRTAVWIRLADIAFVVILFIGALLIATDRPRLAALLVGAAVAALLSFAIIEPATTRAAFRE
jgi:predicted Ser/Thr protein kinase